MRRLLRPRRFLQQPREATISPAACVVQVLEDRTLLAADLQPFQFANWDDSLVYSTVPGTNTTAAQVTTADNVYVDFGLINFGDVTVPPNWITTRITLGSASFDSVTPFNLTPFGTASQQDINFGRLPAGVYTLTMTIDVFGNVPESNEFNNVRQRTITVFPVDYGDAPLFNQTGFPFSYPTQLANFGARHAIFPGFSLGANVDEDLDGIPSLFADGDDLSAVIDDEDGVNVNGWLLHGMTHTFHVDVTNTAGAISPYLDVWVDFNRDGDWFDLGEQVFSGGVAAGTNNVSFFVPTDAVPGATYARFRLHKGFTGLASWGPATEGEVEDHLVVIQTAVSADVVPNAFSNMDGPIVVRTASQPFGTSASVITTADTVLVDFGFVNAGDESTVVSYSAAIQLDGNQPVLLGPVGPHNPNFGVTYSAINFGQLAAGVHTLTLITDLFDNVLEGIESNNFFQRTFVVEAVGTADFGDAPTAAQSGFAASYPTRIADGGARHTVVPGFHLGANVDAEADGRASLMAVDDDQIGTGPDDEDGVTVNGALIRGSNHSFDVTVTNTAGLSSPYLDVWVDFNRDGDWNDPGERVFSGAVAAGTINVAYLVPAAAQHGQTYARFRLHNGTTGLAAGGPASEGEVEDYVVQIQVPGDWVSQGPAPVLDGLSENVNPQDQVTGAVHTVLAHPTNADILYLGSVNGGIWKTTNATATNPFWTSQTDFLGSLSISAMAFDPTDGTHNTLVAGTGNFSSFFQAGATGLVYRTTDGGANWTNPGSVGLAGENISGIAASGNAIVVSSSASNGGLFRSTNGGATFTKITSSAFASSTDFFDLVVDRSDVTGQRLYAAGVGVSADGMTLSTGGIYRSNDFGATWTKITGPAINAAMENLLVNSNAIEMTVHPTTGRLYVAILVSSQPQGIFHTNNGTAANPTWTQMDVPILPQSNGIPLTAATNTSPIVVASSVNHGLSTGNFVQIRGVTGNTAANGIFRVTIVTPSIFSLDLSSGNGDYAGGGSWTKVSGPNPRPKELEAGSQGRLHFSIVVDPANQNILYVGGDRQDMPTEIGARAFSGALFRGNAAIARNPSLAPSPQWDHLTHFSAEMDPNGGTARGTSPHADSREMVFDAVGNLIEVDDGGVYKRTNPQNNTGDWFSLAGNLATVEFHAVAYDRLTKTIIGGTQDNGTQAQQVAGGTVWDTALLGDGGIVAIDNIVNAASNQSVRYTSAQNLAPFIRTVYDTANQVVSSSALTPTVNGAGTPLKPQFYTPVRTNNAVGNRLLIVGDNSIYESTNGGATITEVGPNLGPNTFPFGSGQNAVDYGTAGNVNAAYVGTNDKIAVRTTSGTTFSLVDPSLLSVDAIEDVVMAPADFNTAFAIDSNQVFRTTNAGSDWTDVTGNLMQLAGGFLQTMAFVPGVTDFLIVGGALGVFAAQTSSLSTWVEVGTNLPNAIAFDLDYDAADDVLLVGTLGHGAWLMHQASAALANLFNTPQADIQSITVNSGDANRAGIRELTIEFDQAVTIAAPAALNLFNHTTGLPVDLSGAVLDVNGTSVTWVFADGPGGMSDVVLADGRYTAELAASATTPGLAQTFAFEFHKLAGDVDGDALVN
ncbi:MAG: GEVED domain-containing protein, partial [Planctomycetaceae bacterium]